MSAIETIMKQLDEAFDEMDAKVLEETKVWAAGRKQAVAEFKNNEENIKRHRRDPWGYYAELHRIAGGKSWYQVFAGTSIEYVMQFVEKNCKAIAEKRNASIAKKLIKAEVTEVADSSFNWTTDGFHGTFVVNTNKGKKVVRIKTIYAGGYNIQCLHLRTLVNIK